MSQKTHTMITTKEDHILIEKYWLLPDGQVAIDTTTEPSRWLYEYQLVQSRIVDLDECPYEVRTAFEKREMRLIDTHPAKSDYRL